MESIIKDSGIARREYIMHIMCITLVVIDNLVSTYGQYNLH